MGPLGKFADGEEVRGHQSNVHSALPRRAFVTVTMLGRLVGQGLTARRREPAADSIEECTCAGEAGGGVGGAVEHAE